MNDPRDTHCFGRPSTTQIVSIPCPGYDLPTAPLGLDSRTVRSEDVRSVVCFFERGCGDKMPPTVEDRFLESREHFHQLRSKGMAVVKHQEKGR